MNPYLLLALLQAPIVKRQIRAKQLTADTIDSIVGRFPEVILPLPRDPADVHRLSSAVERVVTARAASRVELVTAARRLEERLLGRLQDGIGDFEVTPGEGGSVLRLLGASHPFEAFTVLHGSIRDDILIPKYYDPLERSRLEQCQRCRLISIQQLVDEGVLSLETGHEVGKINYGSGPIPFVRTSDLGNWELRTDVKQRVSQRVYLRFAKKQSVAAEDILIVRDGTYLVGSATMVQPEDLPLLYCGGIYRLRSLNRELLNPYLLFALLNLDLVRLQMRNRRFTRDVIDTLGHRLKEVVLPLPEDDEVATDAAGVFERIVRDRVEAREELRHIGVAAEEVVV